ncbi:MAG: 5-formyltetrahydrofolate cyclo-ligase [Lentisphaeria bacterium]|nr:5-formyltetrahydrofolate cyclo-ligase [Lentisphaeria bacterium]
MPLPEAGKLKYPGFQQWYREKLRLDITGEKQVLRRKFSALRKSLSSETRQQYNAAICAAIASLECFRQAEFIAAYIPFGGEVDLSPLFCGKQVLLPRFVPERGVYELVCVDDFKRNLLPGKYGIPEPRPELPAVPGDIAASRALFLTPAVSCDRTGTRLGRGGGYYDRMLAGVKIPPVAVIYSCQLSDTPLPGTAHDIKMKLVVTEREVIHCSED